MSVALTNIDVLHHGWEDAVTEITPHLPEVRATMETRYAAAVHDDRLDEEALLDAVREVTTIAARVAGADTARLLSRALHRVVYEFLLSLDAVADEENADPGPATGIEIDPSRLIGFEEVAELAGRQSALIGDEGEIPDSRPAAEVEPATVAEVEAETGSEIAPASELEPDPEPEDASSVSPPSRPRFRLFRRPGLPEASFDEAAPEPQPIEERPTAPLGSPDWWIGPEAPPPVPPPVEDAPAPQAAYDAFAPAPDIQPIGPPEPEPRGPDLQFDVAPSDGFHLTEFSDFVAPTVAGLTRPLEVPLEPPAPVDAGIALPDEAPETPGWHVRRSTKQARDAERALDADELSEMLDADDYEQRRLLDLDPELNDSRNEINDRLRKRRCDDAAGLVQKLATTVGGRLVAELALDAGDRCRALGKGNAALSCYIAASRADPVFEAPLLRLADVCLDDRDIDLAVTYLDRVARLHRMRGDTRGALRLYRKIATIAPYRDDILATLMRANSTGQFED